MEGIAPREAKASAARPERRIGDRSYGPAGFFVLRSPLLPFDEIVAWSEGLTAAAACEDGRDSQTALARDRRSLRERLRAIVERPEVAEAIFLASPDLDERIPHWTSDPESDQGQRLERALVRYFLRMSGRPTPFGLFAGCSVGSIGRHTRLALAGRTAHTRRSRLDMDYLWKLVRACEQDPAIRAALRFHPNTTLYRASGRLRFAESQLDQPRRSHRLVAVDPDPPLERALAVASGGRRPAEIAAALIEWDSEIQLEEANAFVGELIDSQVLVSELEPAITGADALEDLCARLSKVEAAFHLVQCLREAEADLRRLDEGGGSPADYRRFAARLGALPVACDLKKLIQVDMLKSPLAHELGDEPAREILRGVQLLQRLGRHPSAKPLERFAEEFRRRYGDAVVPLMEALDEELGVGFMRSDGPSAHASPLLAGLPFPVAPRRQEMPWSPRDEMLLHRYAASLAADGTPVEITDRDIETWGDQGAPPLPDSFAATVVLGARSTQALEAGEFEVRLESVNGPSGARLLGRFCHLDEGLHAQVRALLRAEEAHRPDAVFAEIAHLPQGRLGNVLHRPALRSYEIPFLARSGVEESRRIPVTDLTVELAGDRIVLRSRTLGREVIPRLTSAHNYDGPNLGVYRFLCHLQSHGCFSGAWSWGFLETAPFLPQVRSGRLVLSPARWRLAPAEVASLTAASEADGFVRLQAWRRERRPSVPRWIELVEGDHTLPLDLENVLAVEVLFQRLRSRGFGVLREIHPAPDHSIASSPEGSFRHEIVIPLERLQHVRSEGEPKRSLVQLVVDTKDQASFLPGSEWLYAKLYCGASEADHVLRELVAPLVKETLASGATRRWFFVRYADPDWHVRLRLAGEKSRLNDEVIALLHARASHLQREGRLRRLELGTYDREVDRYGGPAAIELAEEYFEADSEAALSIVRELSGDAGTDLRWRLTLLGMDRLLHDLGLGLEARLAVVREMHASLWRELRGDKTLRRELGLRYRDMRSELEALLGDGGDEPEVLGVAREAFRRRQERTLGTVARLRELERSGRLSRPLAALAPSFVHMHANRLLRSAERAQELVLYDLLCRVYDSRRARGGGRAPLRSPTPIVSPQDERCPDGQGARSDGPPSIGKRQR